MFLFRSLSVPNPVGGIIATFSFQGTDYAKGYKICVSFICLSGFSCILYLIALVVQNRSRAGRLTVTHPDATHASEEQQEGEILSGDMNDKYRYQL